MGQSSLLEANQSKKNWQLEGLSSNDKRIAKN